MISDRFESSGQNSFIIPQDFAQILHAIPAFVWCASPDGSIEFLNERGLTYTGFTLEQVQGWSWKDTNILHPGDMQDLLDAWNSIIASGEEGEIQARMKRFDGAYRWFLFRVAPLRNSSGDIVAWWGVDVEIDGRKRAEEQLLISQSYLSEAQRISRTGSLGWKSSGECIWSDETFCILGYDRTVQPSMELIFNRVHPEDKVFVRTLLERAKYDQADVDFEHRLLMPDEAVKYVRVMAHAVQNEAGQLEYVGALSDVTSARKAEELHQGDQRQIRRIIDAIPQVIFVLEPDCNALYANQLLLDYSGLSIDEVAAEDFPGRIFHPDDIERLGKSKRPFEPVTQFELEMRMRRKDGQFRWFVIHYKPLLDDEGHILRWYATGTDIDERKRKEEQIQNENLALREEIDRASMFEEIVGSSKALHAVLQQVAKVAATDSTVLLLGETGTGKELIARAIHKRSKRSNNPFIRVNCAAIPSALIASELFGYEKGAFTGALQRHPGRFEAAAKGTIFLDEIGELPTETQIALLRVLQEREFERMGSNVPISTDVRVLAATNRNLQQSVDAGAFRQDLFYRLNVVPIEIPPLRDRVDDIPILVEYLVERHAKLAGKKIRKISKRTLELFQQYSWPGNVRELQNVIERAIVLCDDDVFSVNETWLKHDASTNAIRPSISPKRLERLHPGQERETIEAALRESKGRISGPSGAAVILGLPRQTLESKIARLGINRHQYIP